MSWPLIINPEKVLAARREPLIAEVVEEASLLIPDGIGVVMAGRVLHGVKFERVAGADLMQEICRLAAETGYRIFIYGAEESVNQRAVQELERRFPGIQIVGRSHGFVDEGGMPELIGKIDQADPEILFVALGSPRQEAWIQTFAPQLSARVCMGIGGTLDTIVGSVKRAPVLAQGLGIEWLYRLIRQPSRIGRQRFLALFVWLVAKQKLFGFTDLNAEDGEARRVAEEEPVQ